ncbi:unnamed protein product, partial [Allacma fusca]
LKQIFQISLTWTTVSFQVHSNPVILVVIFFPGVRSEIRILGSVIQQ